MERKMETRALNDGTKMLLHSDEWELLEIFRSFDDDQKRFMLEQMESLAKVFTAAEQPAQPDKIIDFQKQKKAAEGHKDGK